MAAFITSAIGRGMDLFLDRLWIDSIGGVIAVLAPPTSRKWGYLLLYAIVITVMVFLTKKAMDKLVAKVFRGAHFEPGFGASREDAEDILVRLKKNI